MNQEIGNPDIFEYESHKFNKPAISALMLIISIFIIGFFAYAVYRQLFLGQEFGTRPLDDTLLVILALFFTGLILLIDYIIFTMKMVLEVRRDKLILNLSIMAERIIKYDRIESVDISDNHHRINPGGFAYKVGIRERSYNIPGTKDYLIIRLKDGLTLSVSSNKPESLLNAILEAARFNNIYIQRGLPLEPK
ncbi:MAG: hypothetical protein JW737_10505 [Acidobacteria bacterium]|nr:hypothetical protein [Acidobacteriota bacterium]